MNRTDSRVAFREDPHSSSGDNDSDSDNVSDSNSDNVSDNVSKTYHFPSYLLENLLIGHL